MKSLLFLCVANSARSQMAEGLARHMTASGEFGAWQVYSAGSAPGSIHPLAVEALAEINISAEGQHSKGLADLDRAVEDIDTVITLCKEEHCPVLPATVTVLRWTLPDPAGDGATLASFRQIRDQIQARLEGFFKDGQQP